MIDNSAPTARPHYHAMTWLELPGCLGTDANSEMLHFFGIESESDCAQALLDKLHPEDVPAFLSDKLRAVSALKSYTLQARIRDGLDEYHHIVVNGSPEPDHRSSFTNYRCVAQILRPSSEALPPSTAQAERHAALVRDLPAHIALLDTSGRIIEVNSSWNRFAEANSYDCPSRGVGTNYIDLCTRATGPSAAEAPEVAEGIRQILRGERDRFELEYPCHSGVEQRWFQLLVSPLKNGSTLGAVVMHIDITRRKLAEQHVAEQSQAMAQQAAELIRQAQELSRSNADLERFAFVASHDLKEPLRMVASYVQLLERRYAPQLDEQAREFIQFAVEGVRRMDKLISALLDFCRTGRDYRVSSEVDSTEVVRDVLSLLDGLIGTAGATIEVAPLPKVMMDRTQLHQVFQNLLTNAIKFRDPKRTLHIRIGAEELENASRFSVSDNGIGIAPQYSLLIFELFQRLNSRGDFEGSGIGLAICKRMIEQLEGRLWVESQPGEGSTFFFTIPKRERPSAPDEKAN